VVVIEPIPQPSGPFDPLECLASAEVLQECRYVSDEGTSGLEGLYRRLAEDDDRVLSLDLDRLVCPFLPICDPIVDEEVVKVDRNHLTAAFAEGLAPAVSTFLEDSGVLPKGEG
jgi:hypothetical protein